MKKLFSRLFDHQQLRADEAQSLLAKITQGELNNSQIAAVMTIFRMRPLSVEELLGFRAALLASCVPLDLSEFDPIDLCGTGGDEKQSFNISTLAAVLVAACGVPVAKHGNYAVSSKCGSSNVLEALGIRFTSDQETLKRQLREAGITFIHAPLFHPGMKAVASVRKELEIKTFFNILGPLIHPAQPSVQLLGVYNLETMRLYREVARRTKRAVTVVHSLDGYDEVSLTGEFRVVSNSEERVCSPSDMGLPLVAAQDLVAPSDMQKNMELFEAILQGSGTEAQRNVVVANAAWALYAVSKKKGEPVAITECVKHADAVLRSGKAYQTFEKFRSMQD